MFSVSMRARSFLLAACALALGATRRVPVIGVVLLAAFGDGWPADLDGRALPEVRIGRLSLTVAHDTRNNIFNPTSGHMVESELVAASPRFGGTTSYQQFNIRGFNWTPLGEPFILGLRGDVQTSRGDIPFSRTRVRT